MKKIISFVKENRILVASYLIAASVYLAVSSIAKSDHIRPNTFFLIVFVGIKIVLDYKTLDFSKYRKASTVLGFLYAFCTVIGYEVQNNKGLIVREFESGFYKLFYLGSLAVELVGYTFIFSIIVNYLLIQLLDNAKFKDAKERNNTKHPNLIIWAMILICWLPYYIIYWPGVLTQDSITEISMQTGLIELTNHHPVIHQITIKPFLAIGNLIGSYNFGVGLYSLFQMAVLSGAFTLALVFIKKIKAPRLVFLSAFAFFAFVPLNAMYSITMWKDILMGAFSLISIILLYTIDLEEKENNKTIWLYVAAFVSLFLFCIYRNNGFYAFCIFAPFYLVFNRKKHVIKKAALAVFVIVAVLAYQHLIFDVLNIKKSGSGEALSVPLQQIARTVRDNPDSITEEEYKVLGKYFKDPKDLGNVYYAECSDSVKAIFNSEAFKENKKEFLNLWFTLLLKNPGIYIDAFLAECYGYWYPDVTYWVTRTNIVDAPQLNLYQPLGGTIITKLADAIQLGIQVIPGVSAIYSIAFYAWLFAFGITVLAVKKRMDLFTPVILLICLWFSTLFSPVFCEFRYLYSLAVTAPVFLAVCLVSENNKFTDKVV